MVLGLVVWWRDQECGGGVVGVLGKQGGARVVGGGWRMLATRQHQLEVGL